MPWEKQYDQTDVVERAMHAFWARGYEGTSVADLVKATGINRGSLYTAFDGKRGLFVEALRHYDRRHRSDFLDKISRKHEPVESVIAVFDAAAAGIGKNGKPAGCLLVNTALELSPHDPEIGMLVQASFQEVEAFFGRMIENGKESGALSPSLTSAKTAKALLSLFLGLRVLARSGADQSTRETITSQARAMLE